MDQPDPAKYGLWTSAVVGLLVTLKYVFKAFKSVRITIMGGPSEGTRQTSTEIISALNLRLDMQRADINRIQIEQSKTAYAMDKIQDNQEKILKRLAQHGLGSLLD